MAPFGHNVAPPVSVRPAGAVASGTNPRQSSTASKDAIRSQECSEIKPLADLPCPARVDYLFSVEEFAAGAPLLEIDRQRSRRTTTDVSR